jgi:hypothetical protein
MHAHKSTILSPNPGGFAMNQVFGRLTRIGAATIRARLLLAGTVFLLTSAPLAAQSGFTITSPTQGSFVPAGQPITVTWTGGDPLAYVNVQLIDVAAFAVYQGFGVMPNTGSRTVTIGASNSTCGRKFQFYVEDSPRTTWTYGPVFTVVCGPLYDVCLLYDPTKVVKSGATVPIKLQLCDSTGNDLSSWTIVLQAISISQTSTSISGPVEDSGDANPENDFRFDPTLGSSGGYIFNLSTKGLSTGTYSLDFTVTGDSFVYSAPFQVR